MITKDKITEIFCILDEFSKNFDAEMQNHSLLTGSQKPRRHRKASLRDSEIMTILLVFHFGTFANFKHYYLHFIKVHLRAEFPSAVSYNRMEKSIPNRTLNALGPTFPRNWVFKTLLTLFTLPNILSQ